MKILVAIKQVPVRDSPLVASASGRWIEEAGLSFEIDPPGVCFSTGTEIA